MSENTKSPARAHPAGWILPPFLLLATGLAVWIVLTGPSGLFGWVFGGLVVCALVWVVVSALFPAKADRNCPACGRDTLVRMEETSTEGVVCKACHWRNEEQSSFLLAEEEGAIEPLLLARRRRLRDANVRIQAWTGPSAATRRSEPDVPVEEPVERER